MTTTKLVAGEDLLPGDLVAVCEDGKVRYVAENSQARPLYVEERVVVKNGVQGSTIVGTNPVQSDLGRAMASTKHPNGGYAVAYTSEGIYCVSMFDLAGHLIARQTLGQTPDVAEIAIASLGEKGVVVAFKQNDGLVQFYMFDENGTLTNTGLVANSTHASSISLAVLDNGFFVIAFATDDKQHQVYAVLHDTKGAPVQNTKVDFFSNPTTFTQSVAVAALVGGGYVIAYGATDGTSGKVYFKIYDHAGSVVADRAQAGEDISLSPDAPFVSATGLTGGGFAIGSYGGIGPGFQLSVFDAKGANLGGHIVLDPFDQNTKPNRLALAGLDNGNVAVAWAGLSYAYGSVYTAAGAVVFSKANYGATKGSIALAAAESGAVVAHQGVQEDGKTIQVMAGQVGPLLYGEVAPTAIDSGVAYTALTVLPFNLMLPYEVSGSLIVGGHDSQDLVQIDTLASYTQGAQSVIGVVVESASKDEAVEVVVEGSWELRVPFKLPYSGDFRSAGQIKGQQLSIIGNTAFLKGIQ